MVFFEKNYGFFEKKNMTFFKIIKEGELAVEGVSNDNIFQKNVFCSLSLQLRVFAEIKKINLHI